MKPVPHGEPYAGKLHVRFDEGAGVPDNKGRPALLYTLYRVVGLVCGGILSVEIIAVLIYSVCRCVKPNAPACVGLFASIVAAEH